MNSFPQLSSPKLPTQQLLYCEIVDLTSVISLIETSTPLSFTLHYTSFLNYLNPAVKNDNAGESSNYRTDY